MTISDPIADMLTRIRNAIMARHENAVIPASKTKIGIAKILKEEGFINDYEVVKGKPAERAIKVYLRYFEGKKPAINGLERVSKPGLRVYAQKSEIPRVYGGMGIAIISTSKGLKTGQQAWHLGTSGEILCYVW